MQGWLTLTNSVIFARNTFAGRKIARGKFSSDLQNIERFLCVFNNYGAVRATPNMLTLNLSYRLNIFRANIGLTAGYPATRSKFHVARGTQKNN